MSDPLPQLQRRLHHPFHRPELLEAALTHPSYLQEEPEAGPGNQRLEFLGDAVLQLVITEALFAEYPDDREGALSARRAALAKGRFLSQLADEIGLAPCLRLSASEEAAGGRGRASILEDAFEALIGAVFLDSDFATARRVILAIYGPLPERLGRVEKAENPKGRLQELVQPDHGNQALRYEVTRTSGKAHARQYEVTVWLRGRAVGTGRGTSKKRAEEAAARDALGNLGKEKSP